MKLHIKIALGLVLGASLVGGVQAQANATAMHPAWSPDGEWIAFASPAAGDPDIYLMRPDGSDIRALTTGTGAEGHPAWSPNGEWIAFESDRDGTFDIWVVGADGTELQALSHSDGDEAIADWSPDARWVAYTGVFAGNQDIYLMETEGEGALILLTEDPAQDHTPRFSPDGLQITFDSRRAGPAATYIMPVDGSEPPRALSEGPLVPTVSAWSRSGTRLAVTSTHENRAGDLYILDLETGEAERVVSSEGWDGAASWSPDDQSLVFQSNRSGAWQIYVVNLAKGVESQITR